MLTALLADSYIHAYRKSDVNYINKYIPININTETSFLARLQQQASF